jgi:hypothetical protein
MKKTHYPHPAELPLLATHTSTVSKHMALGVIPKACGTIAPDFGQRTVWQLPGIAPRNHLKL